MTGPALGLLLSLLAGLFTALGSVVVFVVPRPSARFMSLVLGLSAGVMILVSFVELLQHGIEVLGFGAAHAAFFGGMLLMLAVDVWVPHEYKAERSLSAETNRGLPRHMGGATAAAHRGPHGRGWRPQQQARLLKTGVLVALGMAIHNFPEGVATLASTLHEPSLGIAIAAAIALHNIPEGLAVAAPVYAATGSRKRAFLWSFLPGVAEPIGAALAALFLLPFLNPTVLGFVLAAVGGVMTFISLDELIPVACSFGEQHHAILGAILGMIVMAISLSVLR